MRVKSVTAIQTTVVLIGLMAVVLVACSDTITATPQSDQAGIVATQVAQGVQATMAAQSQATAPLSPLATIQPVTATAAPNITMPATSNPVTIALANTIVPATNTAVPPTNTRVPPTATKAPTATPKPKADTIHLGAAAWHAIILSTPDAHAQDENGVLHVMVYTSPVGNWVVSGIPRLDGILYTDLDGKAGDEAIVPVLADNKKGDSGFVVYTGNAQQPRYLTWQFGWQLKLNVANNTLNVIEQDCTPYGFNPVGIRQTSYSIKSDRLYAEERLLCPIDNAQKAVEIYLKARNYNLDIAYALLSPAYQKANPYDKWAKQYEGIHDVEVVTFRPTTTPDTVFLTFRQTEADGTTHSYTGTWKVTRNAERNNWQMADPAFQPGGE